MMSRSRRDFKNFHALTFLALYTNIKLSIYVPSKFYKYLAWLAGKLLKIGTKTI